MARELSDYVTIYRRFRTDPRTGKQLDAHAYGLKAWPIRVRKGSRPKPNA